MDFPSMAVILESLSTEFTLSPELDDVVFNIAGIPYSPPRTQRDIEALDEFKKLCYEKIYEAIDTHYSIILLNSTPLTLQVLKELREKPDKPNASDWLILSFFHDDEELKSNKVKVTDFEYLNPQILIDDKNKDFNRLSDYPFIKRILIPHDFLITSYYLKSLFEK
jgi:hypothetical protein